MTASGAVRFASLRATARLRSSRGGTAVQTNRLKPSRTRDTSTIPCYMCQRLLHLCHIRYGRGEAAPPLSRGRALRRPNLSS